MGYIVTVDRDIAKGLTVGLIAIAATLCASMITYTIIRRKFHTSSLLAASLLLMTSHFIGGLLLSCHSLPYLVTDTDGAQNNSNTSTAEWTERVQCFSSITLFHIGFLLFFGPAILILHRLSLDANYWIVTVPYPWRRRRPFFCSQCIVPISILLICTVYLALWLSFHPPTLPEHTGSPYLHYLLIVENMFLIFGIFLTYGKLSHFFYNNHNRIKLMRTALALCIAVGIAMFWTKTLVRRKHEKVLISTVQSTLYVIIFMSASTVIPTINLCRSNHKQSHGLLGIKRMPPWTSVRNLISCGTLSRVDSSDSWTKRTRYLNDERRMAARKDVPSLPTNPDAQLSEVYY